MDTIAVSIVATSLKEIMSESLAYTEQILLSFTTLFLEPGNNKPKVSRDRDAFCPVTYLLDLPVRGIRYYSHRDTRQSEMPIKRARK